ncbi:unnamed protein product [Nyctereutes procyonoides]|uniref:(raccoon dog) hypothetical protein n=1 Tax=Nyctereutes procyonoides TaxID=34880 RepID=A0A811YU88_NYCPR|nr:unnamed protein product [Nyctereutes procyonoides]
MQVTCLYDTSEPLLTKRELLKDRDLFPKFLSGKTVVEAEPMGGVGPLCCFIFALLPNVEIVLVFIVVVDILGYRRVCFPKMITVICIPTFKLLLWCNVDTRSVRCVGGEGCLCFLSLILGKPVTIFLGKKKLSTLLKNLCVSWLPFQLRVSINQIHQPSSLFSFQGAEMTCSHQPLPKLQNYEQNKCHCFEP